MDNTIHEVSTTDNIVRLFPSVVEAPVTAPKLKRDGTPKKIVNNKKDGKTSEVFAFSMDDTRKVLGYYREHGNWLHYLLFVVECNMARRIGDTLSFKWYNFFDPATGKMRSDLLAIREDKTDKLANPHINQAVRDAIFLYIEKTGCDPSIDNYSVPVFTQLTGNFKGRVITSDAFRKSLKKAAAEVGIEYNVGTHSARKTFGAMSKMLHPGDYNCMEILQRLYNHSSVAMTNRYIGLEKKDVDRYYDDMGDNFNRYVVDGKKLDGVVEKPVVSLDVTDLRALISMAYDLGMDNAGEMDPSVHVNAITDLLGMADQLYK